MFVKYRVHEVAKDFDEPSKKFVDVLNENFPESTKKNMTALSEDELNFVFDVITKEYNVESFDEYFEATKTKAKTNTKADAKTQAKPEAKTEAKPENKAKAEPVKEKKPAMSRVEAARAAMNQAAAKTEAKTEAKAETKAETKAEAKPEAKAQTEKKDASKQQSKDNAQTKPAAKQNNNDNRKAQNNKPNNAQQNDRRNNNNNNQQAKQQSGAKNNNRNAQNDRNNSSAKDNRDNQPKQNKTAQQPKNQQQNNNTQKNNTKAPANNAAQNKDNNQQNNQQNNQPIGRGQVIRRTVDTRSAVVDLEKYNEKFDLLAPERSTKDSIVKKQKLTQKSQQYRGKPKNSRKETEAERLKRIDRERKLKPITVTIPEEITVGELASRLKVTAAQVIKKLMMLGVMATVNETIDFDTASLVAEELHAKVEREVVVTIEEQIIDDSVDTDDNLQPRSPVVVVMGHVDHGKTSLLDAIRNAHVTATEAGGITQHIGAYRVPVGDREVTFLDTPGHAAFTSMRARGAQVTDIAVLVVAADDGIMPQTVEAINHAKAAGVSIIVAINKMDKEGANPDRIKQQLTEYELVPEEWGGDTICIPVSALKKEGIDELLEMLLLTADMKELRANPDRAAKGSVIEARLDKGRGPVATILVQNGTLHLGDVIVAGTAVGRIRAMVNDKGQKVDKAGPSMPVEITGLAEVPSAGDSFDAVTDERLARQLVEQRKQAIKEEQFKSYQKITLDNLFESMQEGDIKELNIIVKADVQGSVEAVRQSLEKLSNDEVHVKVIHGAVGAVSESDVMLANASNAIIVGFNVRPQPTAQEMAEREGVDVRLYRIIYDCIEEIEAAMKGMLAPKFKEVVLGRIEVRDTFKISNVGTIAGCYVQDGKVTRNAQLRVVRDGIVIAEDKIDSLRRFKDDVKEVAQGFECGIGLDKFNDVKVGDIYEAFIIEQIKED